MRITTTIILVVCPSIWLACTNGCMLILNVVHAQPQCQHQYKTSTGTQLDVTVVCKKSLKASLSDRL